MAVERRRAAKSSDALHQVRERENVMRQSHLISASGGAMLAGLIAATTAPTVAAQEMQKWHGQGVLVVTQVTQLKLEDRAGHMVGVSDYDGAVYNAQGKPFLDKARYQVAGLVDTQGSNIGYKTFSEADGSKVFAKYAVTQVKLPEINGTFEFTGGTGKYEGITGRGTFHLVRVSDKAAVDELTGEYTLPTMTGSSSK
jgi:hypothetical protein